MALVPALMVKVAMAVHPNGLGPKESAKAWYSYFLDNNSRSTNQIIILLLDIFDFIL